MISIIIPAYNRCDLLGATLDSIFKQSFKNWECIVVDDGSKDYTMELMEFYCERDSRIQFYKRPGKRIKGANACRNYGFQISRGRYIQWFDSDDLMVPEFLEIKFISIQEFQTDFVISKSLNFRDPDPNDILSRNENYYRFEDFTITNFNYVSQRLNWLTYDFFGKRELCEKVDFNENLKSSQERNYFSKLTCYTVNATIIDKYLTKRRIHTKSIRGEINSNKEKGKAEDFRFFQETWKDIAKIAPGSDSELYLLFNLMDFDERKLPELKIQSFIINNFLKQMRFQACFFFLFYKYVYCLTGKGYTFRKIFLRQL